MAIDEWQRLIHYEHTIKVKALSDTPRFQSSHTMQHLRRLQHSCELHSDHRLPHHNQMGWFGLIKPKLLAKRLETPGGLQDDVVRLTGQGGVNKIIYAIIQNAGSTGRVDHSDCLGHVGAGTNSHIY